MKARIPISKKQKEYLRNEAQIVIQEEVEKQRNDFTRKLFKLMCYVLNEKHGFGKMRLSHLINDIGELVEESDTDEIFWEHLDRHIIDRMGLPFDRDYSD